MSEKLGVEGLKKVVLAVAEAANVVSKVVHGKGLLVALSLMDELSALGGLDADTLKAEVKDLSLEEKEELKKALKDKLVLQNPAVEAKIEAGLDVVDEAVGVVQDALKVVEKIKALAA